MTTGPENIRTSTNDSESFDSLPLPRDVSLFQEFDTAMESHLSTDDLPPNLQSDESLRLLAKSRLFNSFCIANTNDRVMELNKHIAKFVVKHFHLKRTHCIAQEESEGGEDTTLATAEEMANHNEASIPVHDLPLFRGARVTLLRNIALSRACANGSTFIVMEVGRHSVKLMNVTPGAFYGAIEFMFRVKLTITLKSHYTFNRLQFPLRMAWAGTAHKFQGQTCVYPSKVFYDIRTPPFVHGQSYVGFSRAQRSSQIIVLSLPEFGRCLPCIVYPRLLNWDSSHGDPPADDSGSDVEPAPATKKAPATTKKRPKGKPPADDSGSDVEPDNDEPFPDYASPRHEYDYSNISSLVYDPHSDPLNSEIDETHTSSDDDSDS